MASAWARYHETGSLMEFVTCPYNTSHVMRHNRFQAHLLKCREQHPQKKDQYRICEYNQTHHVHVDDWEKHLVVCTEYHFFQRNVVAKYQELKEQEAEAGEKQAESPKQPKPERPPTKAELAYIAEWDL